MVDMDVYSVISARLILKYNRYRLIVFYRMFFYKRLHYVCFANYQYSIIKHDSTSGTTSIIVDL